VSLTASRGSRALCSFPTRRSSDLGQSVPGVPGGGAVSEEQIRQEIRLAELEMKQAQKQLETLRKRLDRLTVRSNLSGTVVQVNRSEEHTSELQSRENLVCRLLLEK